MSPHGPESRVADLADLRAVLAAAKRDPWLASLVMRRLDPVRSRLAELRDWLAGLSRRQRRAWSRRLALAAPVALLALALSASPPAHADNIAVDAGVVVIAADGDCSLREAIVNANDDAATHADCAAGNGPDTIILPAASTFTVPDVDNTTDGENGLPSVTSEITIDGNGAIIERAPADPDTFRLFHVASTGDLTLDATTVRNGVADYIAPGSYGGGIFSYGVLAITNGSVITGNQAVEGGGGINQRGESLQVTDSTVTGNSAGEVGGGILADGRGFYPASTTVDIVDSVISGNSASGAGGGIAGIYASLTISGSTIENNSASSFFPVGGGGVLAAYGSTAISNSTISGNSAPIGGGIQNFGSLMQIDHSTISGNSAYYGGGLASFFFVQAYSTTEITNSTISGNSALVAGGGMFVGDSLFVRNSTITGNSAPVGGGVVSGVLVPYSTTYFTNSIVADQVYGEDCYGYGFTSGDFNLESANTCGFTQPNDIQNGNANLGPLALNAPGTTQTHALLPGSDALNAGNCSGGAVTDDQRTVARPQGPACDIGAYELAVTAPTAATIATFTARQDASGRVVVAWDTASEAEVAGFNVYRAVGPAGADGPWTRANDGLIPARGAAAGGASYRFVDEGARGIAEPLRFRLEVVGASGPPQTFGPIDALRRLFEAVLPWVGR